MSLAAFSKAVLAGTAGGAAYLGYTKWQVRPLENRDSFAPLKSGTLKDRQRYLFLGDDLKQTVVCKLAGGSLLHIEMVSLKREMPHRSFFESEMIISVF